MKFLFYISKKYSIPIIQPLAEYLNTTEHEYALFVSQKVLNNLPSDLTGKPIFTSVREAQKFRSDFVLVPGNFVDFRLPGIKVEIFHGLGVEKPSHYKIRHFFDCYCTSGPFVTARFLELQKKFKYFHVLETGWPKVDHILNFSQTAIPAIPFDKKVILFAPTHSRKMQSATELMDVIPQIARDDEFWLIKFHELMNKELIATFRHKMPFNTLFIDDYDITPYLYAADVLISDTSSVLYEFMLLDKPVITFRTQSRPDKGIDIDDPVMLRDVLDWSLQNPGFQSQNRHEHLDEINPQRDGKICENLIGQLLLHKPELEQVKKPVNLFRKMQVICHEHFRRGYLR